MTDADSLKLNQEVHDTYRLAFVGGFFYLAGWLVVAAYGGAFVHSPVQSWLIVVAYVFLTCARILHKPRDVMSDPEKLRWLRMHWLIVITTTSIWGAIFLWAVLDARLLNARSAVLLSSMGLAVAIAHAFSMRLVFSLFCAGLLYLPGLIALWLGSNDQASALVMSVYLVYVLASLIRSNADYRHRLDIDQELREQRDQFKWQGRTDALTDLANRRYFSEVLLQASTKAHQSGTTLSLLVLDIDHFKNINDNFGHDVGDECLKGFAQLLKAQFNRPHEIVARLGGEEFGVLLEAVGIAEAAERAEAFRKICNQSSANFHVVKPNLTVSIGVAEFKASKFSDGDGLYRAADRAVYRAKHEGRNCVCIDALSVAN